MSNLEQLGLYLSIANQRTLIDRNHLEKDVFNRISRLSQCSFYFHSLLDIDEQTNFSSKENLQRPLINFPKHPIISFLDYFPTGKQYRYHFHWWRT